MATITELTALAATPADGDLMVIHDVSAGAPQDKKITTANLFGGLVKQNGNATLATVTITSLNATALTAGTFTVSTGGIVFNTTSTTLTSINTQTIAFVHSDIATGAGETVNLSFTGAAVGDFVVVQPLALLPDGLMIQAYVSATDNIQVRLHNTTGVTITGVSRSIKCMVIKTA
jgi:hypothetical protein